MALFSSRVFWCSSNGRNISFIFFFVRAAACFSHEVSEKKKVNRRLHERDVINSTKLSQIGLVTFYLFVVVARTDLKVSCAYPFYMQLR